MNRLFQIVWSRLGILLLLALQGHCSDSTDTAVRVYAASSLTDAFEDLKHAVEERHPETKVLLVFGASQVLRLQIEQGARADIFASANLQHMRALLDLGRVQPSQIFAYNELVLIVPADNPAQIHSFYDLPKAKRVVIGTEHVPVGRYTRKLLWRAARQFDQDFEKNVLGNVVSEENNVRLVRAKVELGEADAAIVYRTDALGAARIHSIGIPAEVNVRAQYPIALTTDCKACESAARWLQFLLSSQGQAILSQHGFLVK